MSDRTFRSDRWPDDEGAADATPFKALTREEAQALRDRQTSVSPWRVVGVQAGVGGVVALAFWLATGERSAGLSALYGAAVVVVPGALMARGMTSRFSSMSPGTSAVGFMVWEFVKILVSVLMLMLAPKLVQPLSWPALLVCVVVCIKVYWLALLWRGR
jgi:ATP synthase protein I